MKAIIFLSAMLMLAGCGKDEKKSSGSTSVNALQGQGVQIRNNYNGARVAVVCVNTKNVTNAQRMQSLMTIMQNAQNPYYGGMGGQYPYPQQGGQYPYPQQGGTMMNSQETMMAIQQALMNLQYANPMSTQCPQQILAAI